LVDVARSAAIPILLFVLVDAFVEDGLLKREDTTSPLVFVDLAQRGEIGLWWMEMAKL